MVILTLGFFAFSANAQSVKEERKQVLAEKMKTHKTLEATPVQAKTADTEQATAKVRSSGNASVKGELKKRTNATKEIKTITPRVNATKKSGVKVKERPKYDFSKQRQQLKAKRAARTSNVKFDRNTVQQKIKERKSNQ